MSQRPEISDQQWWRLNVLVARDDCDNDEENVFECKTMHSAVREDLKRLHVDGCVRLKSTSRAGSVRAVVYKRGREWLHRYRKEQVARAVEILETRDLPLKGKS